MFWLILLWAAFAGLHFVVLLPTQLAIIGAAGLVVVLWLLWKARWLILGIIGLEALFGGGNDDA